MNLHARLAALCLAVAALAAGCGGSGTDAPAPEPAPQNEPPGPPPAEPPAPPEQPPPVPPSEDPSILPATYRVGPCPNGVACSGAPLPDLAAAANTVKAGDVVHVYPGAQPYPPVRFTKAGTADKPIRFIGITVKGQRPLIRGASGPTGHAVHFDSAHHTVLDNVDISNGIDRMASGELDTGFYAPHQCVRHQAHEVTLSRSKVFACPNNGVFGTDEGSGSLTLEQVEITRSGCVQGPMDCDDGKHPLYVATDAQAFPQAVLRLRNSWVHGNFAGEGVKMRARRGEIHHNWIEATGPHESRALALYGYDEQPQASLAKPIHHDVVGNVLIVDSRAGAASDANSVVRVGSDFDAIENNGNTFGRARFVNNTIVVNGAFTTPGSRRAVFWLFGRPEGLMAFNNLVVAAGGGSVLLMKEEEDDGKLIWAAADKKPRVMLSHNALPASARVLRTKSGQEFTANAAPPAGYAWSQFLGSDAALPTLTSAPPTNRDVLLLPPGSPLRQSGTVNNNPAHHPAEPDPQRSYAVPGALLRPLLGAASPGAAGVVIGLSRTQEGSPTLGAYD
jgi:hypothetical protein